MSSLKDPTARLCRWTLVLQKGDIYVLYSSGQNLFDSDTFSRSLVTNDFWDSLDDLYFICGTDMPPEQHMEPWIASCII